MSEQTTRFDDEKRLALLSKQQLKDIKVAAEIMINSCKTSVNYADSEINQLVAQKNAILRIIGNIQTLISGRESALKEKKSFNEKMHEEFTNLWLKVDKIL